VFKSLNHVVIYQFMDFFQMNALCFLHVRNFKFFILGLLLSCFLFYHVQVFFLLFSLHFFYKNYAH